jgi:putative transposase
VIGCAIDGANRHDSKMFRATVESVPVRRPKATRKAPQGMCLDKGYDYPAVRDAVAAFGFAPHIRSRGEEAKAVGRGRRARRWVVERAHSWTNRFRGVLVRWSKRADNYLAMLQLTFAYIACCQAGLLG